MSPWINTAPLDQRRASIAAWTAVDDSVAEIARRFRIARGRWNRIDRALSKADSLFLIAWDGLPCPARAYVLPVVERVFQELRASVGGRLSEAPLRG